MILTEDLIKIGKFQRTHALKGELNMISDVDAEYFKEGNPAIVDYDGIMVPYYLESIRPKGSTSFLVKLQGIDSEENASPFVNKEVYILKKDAEEWLPEEIIESDEWEGFEIVDEETGKVLGKIDYIDDSTANILFSVLTEDGREILIPANEDFITEVDEEAQTIRMNLPEGLLNLFEN